MNGNGWLKQVGIGVAIVVVSAVIIGAGSNTIANSMILTKQEVKIEVIETHAENNTKRTESIDVMAEQIKDIKEDVGKILEKLDKE
jgi:NhaP-type Na+/H+ and K+/H+ antiporter